MFIQESTMARANFVVFQNPDWDFPKAWVDPNPEWDFLKPWVEFLSASPPSSGSSGGSKFLAISEY